MTVGLEPIASPVSGHGTEGRYRGQRDRHLNVAQARPCRVGPGTFTPSLSQIRT